MDLETEQNSGTGASDCERALELVHLHVGGDLEPAEERSVAAHLASCDACRQAADEAQRLRQVYFEAAAADGDVELWSGIRRALLAEGRLAAGPGGDSSSEAGGVAPIRSQPVEASREREDDSARVGAGAVGPVSERSERRAHGDREGAIYQGRFKVLTVAAAAVLLTLVGAQFLFEPGERARMGVDTLGVRDGSLAELGGESRLPEATSVGNSVLLADGDAGRGEVPAAGLRPIGADQRLIQPDGEVTIVVPVRGFPQQGSGGSQQSLATSIR